MNDLDLLTQALVMTGGDTAILSDAKTAHLLVSCHRVMSQHEIPGVKIQVAAESSAGRDREGADRQKDTHREASARVFRYPSCLG